MSEQRIPVLTSQQILDAGLNVFGLQLFCESIKDKKDSDTFDPISIIYRGIKVTFEPVQEEQPDGT